MSDYLDIDLTSGKRVRKTALISSSGVPDASKIVQTNAQGVLDSTLLPPGIGDDTKDIEAGEALNAGDFINIYDDGGTVKVRKADATAAGKEAHGFVLQTYALAATAKVYFEGCNDQLSGLTPGEDHFLSKTAGEATDDISTYVSGNVYQRLGQAVSANAIAFESGDCILL